MISAGMHQGLSLASRTDHGLSSRSRGKITMSNEDRIPATMPHILSFLITS